MSLVWENLAPAPTGEAVRAVRLDNGRDLGARIMGYGATLLELRVPDRDGRPVDVVLGFDDPARFYGDHPYFNGVVGRYANRIAGARFGLGGQEYLLAANDGANHLHGGWRGFDKRVWRAVDEAAGPEPGVTWQYRSPDGEEGYPGDQEARVAYRLTADNALRLDYEARADAATVVNLTHHAYWNLAGYGDILEHELQIAGAHFLPVDAGLIPTGERRPVAGSAMDFLAAVPILARLDPVDPQLAYANGGYDHNWILDRAGPGLQPAARLTARESGIVMEVWTTQPGLQFYSGNFLDGSLIGKGGQHYGKHAGLCLETQHFPDSPHHPDFPDTVLAAGAIYRQTTLYRFSTTA